MKTAAIPYTFADEKLIEVRWPQEMPVGKRYVIQVFQEHSIYHEGDERSKRCPGHGYPAYTEKYTSVRQFITEDSAIWREKIAQLYDLDRSRTDILAFQMELRPIVLRTQVQVKEQEVDHGDRLDRRWSTTSQEAL